MYEPSKLPEFSPAVVVEPWRKALMDAAEYIRVHGHCKKTFFAVDGSAAVCAVGAMIKVTRGGGELIMGEAVKAFSDFIAGPIPRWNDEPGRSASDVIAALEGAARS